MKALQHFRLAAFALLILIPSIVLGQSDIESQLKQISAIKKINRLDKVSHFKEHYELWFEQHIDPNDPTSETFLQRVLLGHVKKDKPVIIELQGYEIHSEKSGELAKMFKCNQITIEHRYFAESKPKSEEIPWSTLTLDNAAHDQHVIINTIKNALYPEVKFLSTGISKGGQTTMIHRSKYPEDVDASVCYVAPLNFAREDKRIYHFLDTVGTEAQRRQVEDFQLLCLQRKDSLVPMLKSMATAREWSWEMGVDKAFEYYVLEYSFAFWQWGGIKFDKIPTKEASNLDVLIHLLRTSGVSFFEEKGVENLQPLSLIHISEPTRL